MLTFRVLAALLAYPETELIASLDEAAAIIESEGLLPPRQRAPLLALIERLRAEDLLDSQERYVALFDRRRSLSLHLYEHVHGESRDRGQAMVRLAQLYRFHGLEIAARELPDYLPLFVEFLSILPIAPARRLLAEPLPIVAAIGSKLHAAGSPYAAIFDALQAIAGGTPAEVIEIPADNADLEALDREWEEEEVSFLGAGVGGCSPARPATAARRS